MEAHYHCGRTRMADDFDVKTAIQNGDAAALRRCLALDRSRANALIHWGNNDCVLTHPLHYVSDMLFNGVLQKGKELALVDVLLEAGARCSTPPGACSTQAGVCTCYT